jgi:hypothetical protein
MGVRDAIRLEGLVHLTLGFSFLNTTFLNCFSEGGDWAGFSAKRGVILGALHEQGYVVEESRVELNTARATRPQEHPTSSGDGPASRPDLPGESKPP